MVILKAKQLVKHFGGLVATDHVDFHIYQGEIVGLIGPNGAGKTTLFNLISGLLPLTEGSIEFDGRDITGLKPHQICKKGIARTFQLVKLFSHMTARENVRLGFLFGSPGYADTSRADGKVTELLDFVGMSDMADVKAGNLTIVNQKRVEVARALATDPKLLMLDEVMAGLNQTEVDDAIDLVKRIRDRGVTILMIEHVMKATMGISDRIIMFHYGSKLMEGTPAEVAENDKVIEVYLGT